MEATNSASASRWRSARAWRGRGRLFEALRQHGEREDADEDSESEEGGPLKLAIVGRRMRASRRWSPDDRRGADDHGPEAGSARFDQLNGKERQAVQLVDTAGLRKRAKVDDKLECCRPDRRSARLRRSGRAAAHEPAGSSADLKIADAWSRKAVRW